MNEQNTLRAQDEVIGKCKASMHECGGKFRDRSPGLVRHARHHLCSVL
jgi:hypothetical protein